MTSNVYKLETPLTISDLNRIVFAMKRSENLIVRHSRTLSLIERHKMFIHTYITGISGKEVNYVVHFGMEGEKGMTMFYSIPIEDLRNIKEPEMLLNIDEKEEG